ncbi:MAG: hypothetical protein IE922_03050 [Sphingomonadales bacterium]|nr:hypothetical protein [Sphingomonadales bacterium]
MDDHIGSDDPPAGGALTQAAGQDWVVVQFPGRPRARQTAAPEAEAPFAGLEASRFFDQLSILSNFCYGQGHLGLYEKFEQLALDLARAMNEVAETVTAAEMPGAAPRSRSAAGADQDRGGECDLLEVRAGTDPVDHRE